MEKQMYIDGEWYYPEDRSFRDVINPADGSMITKTVEGTREDVRKAIASAKHAFEKTNWATITSQERSRILLQIAAEIDKQSDVLAKLETKDNGKPLREAEIDVQSAADCFRYYGALIRKSSGHTYKTSETLDTIIIHEPVGVCGLIVPWNYPLLMGVWKLAAALAAGNTIVFKPSEVTPLTAIKLFEIFDAVQLPKGVVNLVLGSGSIVGNEIAENVDVDMVSFTGGTETGKKIMQAASSNMKKISLELGGKSPNIIFADTDLETVVDHALYGIYYGSGQVCSAASRILVQNEIYDQFIKRFQERANQIVIGIGDNPNAEMGPLVSEAHMNNVLHYIQVGLEEGAELLCGGYRLEEKALKNGYFVAPTAFVKVEQNMRIVQEEIFGPVVTIQSFSTEEEAIDLANGTKYGLAGAVYTDDQAKALRVIKRIRSGITWVNNYHESYDEAPWSGYKQSGIGHSLGEEGLREFLEVKQINISPVAEKVNWFN